MRHPGNHHFFTMTVFDNFDSSDDDLIKLKGFKKALVETCEAPLV